MPTCPPPEEIWAKSILVGERIKAEGYLENRRIYDLGAISSKATASQFS